jgi:hypothetical protein
MVMKKEPLKFKAGQRVRCLPDNELKLIPTPTITHDPEPVPPTYSSLEMAVLHKYFHTLVKNCQYLTVSHVTFKIPMTVTVKIKVLWCVTPCKLVHYNKPATSTFRA